MCILRETGTSVVIPVDKRLHSQCWGHGFDPHWGTKSPYTTTKPAYCNKERAQPKKRERNVFNLIFEVESRDHNINQMFRSGW